MVRPVRLPWPAGRARTRPAPGAGRASRGFPIGLSRQLAAVGFAAVILHVAVTGTALKGLREVEQAHGALADIMTAQSHFQDADMAHDAIRAAALMALVRAEGLPWAPRPSGGSAHALARAAADFRADLRRVDSVSLPADLDADVRAVRPLQERFATDAERLSRLVADDVPAAASLFQVLEDEWAALVVQQGVVTAAMSEEVEARRAAASRDERAVSGRLTLSAVAALVGLLGLTGLLHRLGRTLASLLGRERDVAETLQHSLLPDRLPELPGLRLAARYSPGGVGTQVGGDWYDVVTLPGGKVGLVMGDVVGHDLHAAADMGQLRNALRACAAEGADPADVLQRLNRLCLQQDLGSMATVLYAVLDPVEGTLEVANAGHYPPLVVTGEGRCFLEAQPCAPVGAVREVQYTTSTHALPAGSLLLLYTDGLVERRGAAVDEGLARLRDLVVASPEPDLERLCDDVLAGMLGDDPPDDDVALLVVAPQAVLGRHVDVLWPAQAERLSLLRHLLERWLVEAGATEQEVYDVVVACSEAATNAIEHAYGPGRADFRVVCDLEDDMVTVTVRDWGQWREARGRDRGRGLGLMEGLMDEVTVSHGDAGTEVRLRRRLALPAGAHRPLAVSR